MKKRLIYILFFAGLVGCFWWYLGNYTEILKPKIVAISKVEPFKFINQNGDTITEQLIDGKVYVAAFFFTTCQGICPQMNDNLKKIIYESHKNDSSFLLLSHTVTPKIDTPATLKAYANKLGVANNKWVFLTGNRFELYKAARYSYTVDDEKNNENDTMLLHTQYVAVVDKLKRVRGIYDATQKKELVELSKKINKLLKE
jgi:protein SCO1